LVIASGLWVAIALARAVSRREIAPADEQIAEEIDTGKPPA